MALTPDQKKRIADLDAKPPVTEAKPEEKPAPFLSRLRMLWFSARTSARRANLGRIIFLLAVAAVALYFILTYQIHKIDFRSALSSGAGSPVSRLVRAIQLQKEKSDILDKGQGQFLSGDYEAAFATAVAVHGLDPKDARAQKLISLLADAVTVRASREFDAGEIGVALTDVRLALKHQPDHKGAAELSLRVAGQLLREAQTHYGKKEHPQAITKAQEVIKINPSDVVALNLLMRTNEDLLNRAGDFFLYRRYYDALEDVRQALRIDPANRKARGLYDKISIYVEVPDVRLRGIIKSGNATYALIQLPQARNPEYAKEGDEIRNFKILEIDPEARTVKLLQIHTRHEFTVALPNPK
jgi:tetratricopeptide (TPR) repeat protein